ncbi:MAG TPA: ZIP family metal transporter [Rhodocyclaceae bacterium]|nr:ZIP family metal transporter [Rhodocyclaceae bacterium]HNH99102.1 ZIP family metal transporter [Rhodocyclaceae bacterium]
MTAIVIDSIRREADRGPAAGARKALGWTVALLGAAALFASVAEATLALLAQPRAREALGGGMIAALATAAGALPVLLAKQVSQKLQDGMLGFGAGVMLAATAFSLIIPGLDAAQSQGAGKWAAGAMVGAGIAAGAFFLLMLDRKVPHEHFIKGLQGAAATQMKRVWLFVAAISLHNLPEGLAIGVGYGGADAVRSTALATGIAIQDVPEGLVVALALLGAGYSRGTAAALGAATGLIEPLGALLGAAALGASASLLPWGLAFAAGAMLFVVSHEIIPESHSRGHEAQATMGLIAGFVVMMLLDTALA